MLKQHHIRPEAERAKELAEIKRRALAKQMEQRGMGAVDDSDDELEIVSDMRVVAEEETEQRKASKAKHIRPSEGRKRQLMLGRVNVAHAHRHAPPVRKSRDPMEQLKVMAKPSFGLSARDKHAKGMQVVENLNHNDLNKILQKRIAEDNAKSTQMKEEEWTKRGGKLVAPLHQVEAGPKALEGAWKAYAEKGLKVTEGKELSEEADDESDGDWTPETKGSASPPQKKSDGDAPSGQEDEVIVSEEEPTTNGEVDNDADEDVDDTHPACPRVLRHTVARPRTIQDSDEDEDRENVPCFRKSGSFGRVLVPDTPFVEDGMPPPRLSPTINHRRSSSSLEDRTEDETDKENNTRLMYDKSEDKENKAVVRHTPIAGTGARGGPLFSLTKGRKRLSSVSPGTELSDDDDNGTTDDGRTPFKELLEHEDDPFASQPLRNEISFAARLQLASPEVSQPTLTPQPVLLDTGASGFSQFPDEDENNENSPFLLGPHKLEGLSQPFEFGTEQGNATLSEEPKQLNSSADNKVRL